MLINKDTFLKIIAYHIQGLINSTCVETRVLSVILQFYLVFLRQDLLLFIAMQTKLADLSSCTRINEIIGVLPLLGLGDPNSVSHACISSRAIALVPGIWVFIYYLQKHFCFYFIFPSFYFFHLYKFSENNIQCTFITCITHAQLLTDTQPCLSPNLCSFFLFNPIKSS